MKVTRRQLRNLINEVLQEQLTQERTPREHGTDTDRDHGRLRPGETVDRGADIAAWTPAKNKENDKKLFLYLNKAGKDMAAWTFSLSTGTSQTTWGPHHTISGTNVRVVGEFHFTSPDGRATDELEQTQVIAKRRRVEHGVEGFNKRHNTAYEVVEKDQEWSSVVVVDRRGQPGL